MRILGAILAGGKSTRFGADKGAAILNGRALMDHVIAGLKNQVETVIVVGRDWPGLLRVEDAPTRVLGPLGGLCGALGFAQENGFDAVLSAGCDVLPVANGLEMGQVIDGHYLLGLWPTALIKPLKDHLAIERDHSMRHWIGICGVELVKPDRIYYNFNTPEVLAALQHAIGATL
jgi:molybdenum cofactor guanylyltransferase